MLKVDDGGGFRALLDALDGAEHGTADKMRAAASTALSSEWVPALTARASTAQQRRLLLTGAIATAVGLGFELRAAQAGALSGGLDSSHWYAVDYGMTPQRKAAPNRKASRRTLGSGRISRGPALIWVGRNLPSRAAGNGRVIYAAVAEKSQDFVAAWVRGLVGQLDTGPLEADYADELAEVGGSWQ